MIWSESFPYSLLAGVTWKGARKVCSHEVCRDVLISLDEGTHHEVLHDDFTTECGRSSF